ncbi:hypothetical protein ACOMHN_035872 [Nucella lapillus]
MDPQDYNSDYDQYTYDYDYSQFENYSQGAENVGYAGGEVHDQDDTSGDGYFDHKKNSDDECEDDDDSDYEKFNLRPQTPYMGVEVKRRTLPAKVGKRPPLEYYYNPHVLENHVVGKAGKSQFSRHLSVGDVVERTWLQGTEVSSTFKEIVVVHQHPSVIGTDDQGKPCRWVRVIARLKGKEWALVSAYPFYNKGSSTLPRVGRFVVRSTFTFCVWCATHAKRMCEYCYSQVLLDDTVERWEAMQEPVLTEEEQQGLTEEEQRGLTEEEINLLPTRMFSSQGQEPGDATRGGEQEIEQCQICLLDLEDGDTLRCIPCIHHFHSHCLDESVIGTDDQGKPCRWVRVIARLKGKEWALVSAYPFYNNGSSTLPRVGRFVVRSTFTFCVWCATHAKRMWEYCYSQVSVFIYHYD